MATSLTFPVKIENDIKILCGDFADKFAASHYQKNFTVYKKRMLANKLAQHATFDFLQEYGMVVSNPHHADMQVISPGVLPQLKVINGDDVITVHCKGLHPDHQSGMPLHWDLYKEFPSFSIHDYISLCDCRNDRGTYFVDIYAVTSVDNLVSNPVHNLINHSDLMCWPQNTLFDLIKLSPLAQQ